jgi:MFS family permease
LAGVTTLLISPFLTPMIIEADPTRRAGMQSAGAQILGGAAGPLAAAFLVSDADVRGVLVLGAAALVLGFAMIFAIHVSARRA